MWKEEIKVPSKGVYSLNEKRFKKFDKINAVKLQSQSVIFGATLLWWGKHSKNCEFSTPFPFLFIETFVFESIKSKNIWFSIVIRDVYTIICRAFTAQMQMQMQMHLCIQLQQVQKQANTKERKKGCTPLWLCVNVDVCCGRTWTRVFFLFEYSLQPTKPYTRFRIGTMVFIISIRNDIV